MNLALNNRGYSEFSGLISPNRLKFIVNIPKNASSYVHEWAKEYGWRTSVLAGDNWQSVNQISVILRDPVERWISGMAQYLKTYVLCPVGPNGPVYSGSPEANHPDNISITAEKFISLYNLSTERIIFDNIYRFDDHVWPQYAFIKDLRPGVERKYFFLDEQFDKKFAPHHGLLPSVNIDRNEGSANNDIKLLQVFLKNLLEARPLLLDRVKNAYIEDYNLIDKAFTK